ncbi:MAG: hypothetical protein J6P75_00640 [Bacteroidales bacterium]|nr:hypothetical protein [Bacteroidales bacterium]
MKRFRTLLLAAGLLAGTTASAQFFQAGSDPFSRWSEMGTEHFRVIYPQGLDSLARAYVVDLEKWQPSVGASAGMAPGNLHWGRLPVVLHPWNPYSNGSVAWAPKRMDLYTHPEAYGPYPQSWMTQLTTHESRHVAQMQLSYRRPFKWVNYLVGEMWSGAVSAFYTPPVFLEGDAVVAETALTAAGRGRNADFLNYYHLAFDNGDWRNWYRWVYGSFKKAGPDYYSVGYMTVAGMRYFYDHPSFTADYFDYVTRHPFPVAKLQHYIKNVSGQSFKQTWQGIMEGFHDIWTEEADARAPFMEMEQVTRKHAYATDYSNGSWVDNEYLAIKEGKDLAPRLVRINVDGSEDDLGPFASNTSSLNPGVHRLFWSETVPGKRWTLDGKSIIRSLEHSGRRRNLTTEGRLYNPQPGPGGIATVEYPVQGGSNLVLIDEEDGHELFRVPAPAGVELADPAWVDSTVYCLAVNDDGYSIWKLEESQWTCVLEPTLQEIENLEGENHVLDFVSDRNGVKELYRYDPATGRAWQLSNSRYGGTDYFWHDGVLWFNAITPEGCAIFKAKPPEPVEVNIREVHRYRVAEKLAEQERALLAEIPGQAGNDDARHGRPDRPSIEVSAAKPYHKVPHLVKFHSWAPLYFDYDAISSLSGDFSFDTASPGLIGLFQNDLGTAWGTVGYSAHPDADKPSEWRHSGHVQFSYTGLYPVLEAGFDIYDQGSGQYGFQRRLYEDRIGYAASRKDVGGPYWTGHLTAYIPFHLSRSGRQCGWVPQVNWSISNNHFDNGTTELKMIEDFVREGSRPALVAIHSGENVLMQTLRGSVRGYLMLPTADSQVYPRWGIGAETGVSIRPGLSKIYTPLAYGYLYGYVPGFTRTQGLRLTALAQVQLPTGAPFGENTVQILPRGFTSAEGRTVARASAGQLRLTADYALPIYVGDISWFSPVAYIHNFLLVPHVDWTGFQIGKGGKDAAQNTFLLSAGADFTVELGNLAWVPFPCSLGVSASWLGGPYFKTLAESAEDGRKPYYVGLVFSFDI